MHGPRHTENVIAAWVWRQEHEREQARRLGEASRAEAAPSAMGRVPHQVVGDGEEQRAHVYDA